MKLKAIKLKTIGLLCFIYAFHNSKAQDKSFEISGNFKLDHYNTFKKFDKSTISSREQGSFQLDFTKSVSQKSKFFSSVEVREDLSDPSRNRIYPKEYYLDYNIKSADFRFGKQKYTWGRADGINPTNNLSPVDYSDFLDTDGEELGQISMSGKFYKDDWTLQAVYIPVFSGAILPKSNSIWSIPMPQTIPNPFMAGSHLQAQYVFQQDNIPANDLSSGQFALKLDGRMGSLDFSTSYNRGYYNLPYLVTQPMGLSQDTLSVGVQRVYIPRDVLGVDFASTIGDFGIRGEGAYFIPRGTLAKTINAKDDYLRYALGMDLRKSMENTNAYFIAQWLQEYVPSGKEYPSTDLNHLFQKALLLRAEFDFRTILNLSCQLLYDFKYNSYYIQPKISYKLSDGIELLALADILGGNDKSLIGLYRHNDRMQVKIKYSF